MINYLRTYLIPVICILGQQTIRLHIATSAARCPGLYPQRRVLRVHINNDVTTPLRHHYPQQGRRPAVDTDIRGIPASIVCVPLQHRGRLRHDHCTLIATTQTLYTHMY